MCGSSLEGSSRCPSCGYRGPVFLRRSPAGAPRLQEIDISTGTEWVIYACAAILAWLIWFGGF